MKHIARFLPVLLLLQPAHAFAWGKTGHRVIAALAEHYLNARTRHGIRTILGTERIIESSNWPDFMRSDPSDFWQKDAGSWHYVTVPVGKTYAQVGAPKEGDAVTALAHFVNIVRAKHAPRAERQLALRFIVHVVGDLHQPLHAGNGTDKGGNDVAVTFFGKPTNLHAVWDSALVDEEELSYSEFATMLRPRITPRLLRRWSTPDPLVWIGESVALRDTIYPPKPMPSALTPEIAPPHPASQDTASKSSQVPALSYKYVFKHRAEMELRLEQGGVRLASYLNWVFARQS